MEVFGPPTELPERRPEGRSTMPSERILPKADDRVVPDETASPPREGYVRSLETEPETVPEGLSVERALPVEVQVRLLESMPERPLETGLRRVPLEREPRSVMVGRDPEPASALPVTGDARPVRPTIGRRLGCSALRLMRPSAPISEDLSACREMAGDCRRSLWTTVRAREFQG